MSPLFVLHGAFAAIAEGAKPFVFSRSYFAFCLGSDLHEPIDAFAIAFLARQDLHNLWRFLAFYQVTKNMLGNIKQMFGWLRSQTAVKKAQKAQPLKTPNPKRKPLTQITKMDVWQQLYGPSTHTKSGLYKKDLAWSEHQQRPVSKRKHVMGHRLSKTYDSREHLVLARIVKAEKAAEKKRLAKLGKKSVPKRK